MTTHVLLSLALSVGAPAAKDKPKGDIDIVGEWLVVSQELDGKPDKPFADSLTFAADGKWERVFEGKPARNCDKYIVDTTAKPATLDLLFTKDTNIRGLYGIVRVDGDILTLSYGHRSDVRPQKFESVAGSSNALVILKRKPKK
jgi:uncharacterized protein (TIGR03067 family)